MPKNNKGAIFVFVFFLLAGSNDGNQTKANLNDIQENRDQKHDDKLDLSVTNNNDHKSETKINEIKANSNLRPEKETRLKSKTLSKMAAGSLRYRNRSSSSSNMTDGDSSSISARTGKLFSLFNIVTFRKSQCDASSGSKGTCMAVSECATMGGGVAQGNCAAGFGVCCVITQSECGSVIQNNCTYIQNPGFPGPYTPTDMCQYIIRKCSDDICVVRLDYERFNIRGPVITDRARCSGDIFRFDNHETDGLPPICGTNDGQHMFLDAGFNINEDIVITGTFRGEFNNRIWRIKVTQLRCGQLETPPPHCYNYLTGVSGQVRSFNFVTQGPEFQHLPNQFYSICVRQNTGYCGVRWTQSDDPFSFKLSRPGVNLRSLSGPLCAADYILIENSNNGQDAICDSRMKAQIPNSNPVMTQNKMSDLPVVDRYCGGTLNCISAITLKTPIFTDSFEIDVHFNDSDDVDEINGIDVTNNNRGFCLNYVQIPC